MGYMGPAYLWGDAKKRPTDLQSEAKRAAFRHHLYEQDTADHARQINKVARPVHNRLLEQVPAAAGWVALSHDVHYATSG